MLNNDLYYIRAFRNLYDVQMRDSREEIRNGVKLINKKIIINALNDGMYRWKQNRERYEQTDNENEKIIYWNGCYTSYSELSAYRQTIYAFGYDVVYGDDNRVIDIVPYTDNENA